MLPIIYQYDYDIPFSRKSNYLYETNVLSDIVKGMRFIAVPEGRLYSLYSVKRGESSFLFTCNERDFTILKKHSIMGLSFADEAKYYGVKDRLRKRVFSLIDKLTINSRLFFKGEQSTSFNRMLIRTNKNFYDRIHEISSGVAIKKYKDNVLIDTVTLAWTNFKNRIETLEKELNQRLNDLKRYMEQYKEYTQIFRQLSSESSEKYVSIAVLNKIEKQFELKLNSS